MKVMMKKVLATLLFCTWAPFASATTVSTDFTDMWWVGPAESGWGANVIQQGDTLFITLFVYGTNNQPTWYVGPATAYQGTVAGAQRFTGLLYKVSGPYFGAPVFDTTTVNVTSVGSITFTAPRVAQATLNYSVDGVNVTKELVRQTWRTENLVGTYIGATVGTFSACASNGVIVAGAVYGVTQSGNNVTITESASNYTCSYTGPYTQSGRMGTITGTGSCSDLGSGITFTASEVRADLDSIGMRMDFTRGSCHMVGRLGGMRSITAP